MAHRDRKQPKPDDAKFRELLLYVAKKSESDEDFGDTKLHKILFLARATAERDHYGYVQHRMVTLREPDLREFSGTEIASIAEVVDDLRGRNARDVSDLPSLEMASRA